MIAALLMTAAAAAASACPASHRGAPLTGYALYDGPITDAAILAPDWSHRQGGTTRQRWPVASVYAQGRRLNLRCEYRRGEPVVVPVMRAVRWCEGSVGKRISLSCR